MPIVGEVRGINYLVEGMHSKSNNCAKNARLRTIRATRLHAKGKQELTRDDDSFILVARRGFVAMRTLRFCK